jgi:hypothetical protein
MFKELQYPNNRLLLTSNANLLSKIYSNSHVIKQSYYQTVILTNSHIIKQSY